MKKQKLIIAVLIVLVTVLAFGGYKMGQKMAIADKQEAAIRH